MRNTLLLIPIVLLLSGCLQDSASYSLAEKDHAITLIRNQQWFWQDTLEVEVVVMRLPVCHVGGSIEGVPRDAKLRLYKAPGEYAEPLFILKTGKRAFAIGTLSCRFQPFQEVPDELGTKLGVFKEVDGNFSFVPTAPESAPE